MALVKASLKLFGGDTVVVRCSERCHMQSYILSVQDRDNAWLTVPSTGIWNVLSDSHSQSLEHSISYIAA